MALYIGSKNALIACLVLVLTGCAGQAAFQTSPSLAMSVGEPGVTEAEQPVAQDPASGASRAIHYREREERVGALLQEASRLVEQGRLPMAESSYQQVLAIAPGNRRALGGLQSLQRMKQHEEALRKAGTLIAGRQLDSAKAQLEQVLAVQPHHPEASQLLEQITAQEAVMVSDRIRSALKKPVTLEFRAAQLQEVFEVLFRAAGLNFVLDHQVKLDAPTTLFVRDIYMEDALQLLLTTNDLAKTMLNENTLLIYPDTREKAKQYKTLSVKHFYLRNADAKQVLSLITPIVKLKDVTIDERLNVLIIRDTPAAIGMVDKIIANIDQADPEVMMDVEVLEISSSHLQDLGIRYPDQLSVSLAGTDNILGLVRFNELQRNQSGLLRVGVSTPTLLASARHQDGTVNLLANPRIRVRNREKAKIHIGDRVPVVMSTTTASGVVSESVSYLDVGLKLDVEPRVYLDNEVAIKLNMEVSSIAREIVSPAGGINYQIGTRNTETTLRLKDGETQVIAGLISDEDRKTAVKVPGLGNIPFVGRLFSSVSDARTKTEIVLLITPRILRSVQRPATATSHFPAGTENALGARPLQLRVVSPLGEDQQPVADTEATHDSASRSWRARELSVPATVRQNEAFTVELGLDSTAEFETALLQLHYDPALLDLVKAEPPLGESATSDRMHDKRLPEPGVFSLSLLPEGVNARPTPRTTVTLRPKAGATGATVIRLEGTLKQPDKAPVPIFDKPQTYELKILP